MDTAGSGSARVIPKPKIVPKAPVKPVIILHKPEAVRRISALIWGDPGAGKTTLACTAPGRKLIFLFDPDGATSLVGVPEDVQFRSVFEEPDRVVLEFKKDNPLDIKDYFEQFDTFIFDSLTNITAKTLDYGVSKAGVTSSEMPTTAAYGARNALALALVKHVLSVTSKAEKHVIFTAHQSVASFAEGEAQVRHTNIALGGKLPQGISPSFSEIWNLRISDSVRGGRILMVRSSSRYTPIKTRMWEQRLPEFRWEFDAEDWEAEENKEYRLDTWYDTWNHYNRKLPHPGSKEFTQLIEGIQ